MSSAARTTRSTPMPAAKRCRAPKCASFRHRDVREGVRKPLFAARMVHKGDLQVRVWQARRDVMNDTVATEDQEQPAGCHQRKARVADRDPGRRTSSGPADICSARTEAGHMTAADQIVRSAKKCLPWRAVHILL